MVWAMRFFCASLDHLGEGIQRLVHAVLGLLGHDHHAVVAPVVGEFDPETVQNAPARRRDQPRRNAIVFRRRLIFLAVPDLKLIEPARQDREHQRHAATQADTAAGEGGVTALVLLVEQRHQKSLLSGPTRRR
jgi:hypothetical protein